MRLRSGCDASRAAAIRSISAPIAAGSPGMPAEDGARRRPRPRARRCGDRCSRSSPRPASRRSPVAQHDVALDQDVRRPRGHRRRRSSARSRRPCRGSAQELERRRCRRRARSRRRGCRSRRRRSADSLLRLARPCANALPSRTTTPGTPPSRTIRLEPSAERHHRHRRDRARRGIADRSSTSVGLEQPFGRRRRCLNQTKGGERRLGASSRAAQPREGRSATAHAAPAPCAIAVGEARRPFGDVAGAEADRPCRRARRGRASCRQTSSASATVCAPTMAALLQPLDQRVGIDALDRRLAGGIDRRDIGRCRRR